MEALPNSVESSPTTRSRLSFAPLAEKKTTLAGESPTLEATNQHFTLGSLAQRRAQEVARSLSAPCRRRRAVGSPLHPSIGLSSP
eukprot:9482602-Pyramimonas_sp.AAC.1